MKKMKRFLMIFMVLISCATLSAQNESAVVPQEGGVLSARELRAKRRAENMEQWKQDMADFKSARQKTDQLQSLVDSLAWAQAESAMSSNSFVLEADYLVLKNGARIIVNSGVNFVSMNGNEVVVQVSPSNFYSGPNGVGGITMKGKVTSLDVTTDKKGQVRYSMNVSGAVISARVDIVIYPGSTRATAYVSPNLNSNNFQLEGYIVPYEKSNVFEGRSL